MLSVRTFDCVRAYVRVSVVVCSCVVAKSSDGYYAIFIVAQIIVSAGYTPLLSLASTYMQVCVCM